MSALRTDTSPPVASSERHRRTPLPWPTCRFRENPWRWTINKAQELAISVPFSHVFLLAWITVYFILTQTALLNPLVHALGYHGTTKQWWDTLLSRHYRLLSSRSWTNWRHMFRSGGEAYLGTLAVLFFTFNPYRHEFKHLHAYWQLPSRILLTLLLAIPLFVIIGVPVHELQHWLRTGALAPALSSHPSLAQKLYTDAWTTKLVVFIAVFIGRRPMFGVFEFVMRRFAERRVAAGKPAHAWHTAPYRAMVRTIATEEGVEAVRTRREQRSSIVGRLELASIALVLVLAVYGVYIINHYAHT
ncbi:MAG: hypothetical protein JO156_16275 [Solirubrobacterales bacterium]|nr:hypothetical protein [Solirubrobacterales bacterium]